MTLPKITVYIPSHNYGRFLGDAIESVLRQKRTDWELLVINDNSTDNTGEVMARYQGDSRVRLFETQGIGLPGACNLALREAKGDYIIRLDGDDIFDENILLVLGEWLDREPELALVFPDYYLIDELGDVFAHERHDPATRQGHAADLPPNGAGTLVRRDLLANAGGYREDLGTQDGFDLWSKLARIHKTANVNLPLFYYRRHPNNLTNDHHRILSARREIKKDSTGGSLAEFKPFIAVIPCRENYDFRPNVWQQDLGGRTLLQRVIESCLTSRIFDGVVVASDNPRVQDTIARYGDDRLKFHQRKPADTQRSKSITATLEKIAAEHDPQLRGVMVVCYVQAPFVTTDTLEEAVFTLVMNHADSSIGVEEIADPVYKRTAHGLTAINAPRAPSTEFDRVYREANVAFASRTRNFRAGSLMGSRIANYVVSPDECLFIHSERTLKIARILLDEK